MFRGIYTAANGMLSKQYRIETIANNLANLDTTGYKKDENVTEAFSEKLLYKRQDNDGYLRRVQNRVSVNTTPLKDNMEQIDISITRGYLTLEDRHGKGYYKNATVARDQDGYLRTIYRSYDSKIITKFGAYLLDDKGNRIKINNGKVNIDQVGNLTVNGQSVAKLISPEAKRSIGTINSGLLTDRVMTNYSQGMQDKTDNPMHISLEGDGFFKVRIKENGQVKYSRSGAMTMDKDRVLKDHLGNMILDDKLKEIVIPEDTKQLKIYENGNIFSKKEDGTQDQIATLSLVNVTNKEDMQKYGHSYMQMIGNSQPNEVKYEGKVLQGYLERSNVNAIDEMVNMIDMFRGFESDQKVINAYDNIMQKAANEIGKM